MTGALERVETWSLRIHDRRSEHHRWCMAAAHAVLTGAEPPPWPGGRRSTGVTRLETITRLIGPIEPAPGRLRILVLDRQGRVLRWVLPDYANAALERGEVERTPRQGVVRVCEGGYTPMTEEEKRQWRLKQERQRR